MVAKPNWTEEAAIICFRYIVPIVCRLYFHFSRTFFYYHKSAHSFDLFKLLRRRFFEEIFLTHICVCERVCNVHGYMLFVGFVLTISVGLPRALCPFLILNFFTLFILTPLVSRLYMISFRNWNSDSQENPLKNRAAKSECGVRFKRNQRMKM